jgi:hypothetical protein
MAFLLAGRPAAADPPGLILTAREARRQRARLSARRLAASAALARLLRPTKPHGR